ncbi:uncharacterized protein LODBEIA_P42910 [Lodderomyces beijingensis]|uniref:Hsp70 nucleotide exchange factor FES1 n=1 Tax=Lodderomyces beijingensis TaxID=1775926 RepID=A0ABP0ZUT7_9ASCO
MEKLLHWSIAQQSGDKAALDQVGEPDQKALNQLFGGPDEAALMKESLHVATNPKVDEKDKVIALENFEMLIENLDNANNIDNLGLWGQIVGLLSDNSAASQLRVLACGIVGVAVQNNPKSQEAFGKTKGLEALIEIASTTKDKQLQLKALYAISSFIRNYKPGYEEFDKLNGWKLVQFGENNNGNSIDAKYDLRVLSLVSSALSNGLTVDLEKQFKDLNLVHHLAAYLNLDSVTSVVDKSLNIISELNRDKYNYTDKEQYEVDRGIQVVEGLSDKLNIDDLNGAKQKP